MANSDGSNRIIQGLVKLDTSDYAIEYQRLWTEARAR
jgi:hypothetical protein